MLRAAKITHQRQVDPKKNLSTTILIYLKEMRDQLRDRRTLFVMLFAPALLYPTLATAVAKLAPQLKQAAQLTVGLVGRARINGMLPAPTPLPTGGNQRVSVSHAIPPLLSADGSAFHESLYTAVPFAAGFQVRPDDSLTPQSLRDGTVRVLIVVPEDFQIRDGQAGGLSGKAASQVELHFLGSDELSTTLRAAVSEVLEAWKTRIVSQLLTDRGMPASIVDPFVVASAANGNAASESDRSRMLWGRILPFVVVMLLLTGAFYPAVDLCAGEKERGTMETLLISPHAELR